CWQSAYESIEPRGLQRLPQLSIVGIRVRDPQILADAGIEDVLILPQPADDLAYLRTAQHRHIDTSQRDRSGPRRQQLQEYGGQGGLSRTAWSCNGHDRSFRKAQIHVS